VPAATNKALDYLVFLRNHYDGDWLKALAAYNAGWGTIDKAVAKNRARGLPTDYWSLDVPTETRAYVPKLLALAQISKQPEKFGINWAYIPDLPYFSEVHFSGQIDLGFAADLAKIDSDELHLLNPGVSRWATPPGGPYRLLVPIDQANDLQERIASMNSNELLPNAGSLNSNDSFNPHVQALEDKAARNTKTRSPSSSSVSKSNSTLNSRSSSNSSSSSSYTVKAGDTLWSIAQKTGTTPDALRKANNLRVGQTLSQGQKISVSSTNSSTNKVASSGSSRSRVTQSYEPTSAATKSTAKKTSSSKTTSHTVKSGDTLMAISRQYKVSVNDIMRWNSLSKNNSAIKPGQRIKLHLD
jgi:membrane-bound lytic murein transglycosylase D